MTDSSASNDPIMYINGSAFALGVDLNSTGVAQENTDNYIIGKSRQ